MKRYRVQIELPDDIEPGVYGCEDFCPFAHWDELNCCYLCRGRYLRNDEWWCPVKLGQCIDD